VFYNPAMAADRDLGVAFVRAWAAPGTRRRAGWEATAATGVRGLRLLDETDAFGPFLFTESNPAAFEVLRRNVEARPTARARLADARRAPDDGPFDYVDLDPFGSPIPFVDAGLSSVRTGGVLAVTATDLIVLAGAQPRATVRRYGARPVRARLGPEGGLRILLAYIAGRARSAGRAVAPLLAYARDHHVRAYLEVRGADAPPDPVRVVAPETWDGPPLPGDPPFGPLWMGPIVDPGIAERLVVPDGAERPAETAQFLERLRDDAAVPTAFYYEPNSLAHRLLLPAPTALSEWLATLRDRGYRAGRTHARPEGFRTDAPRAVVEALARERAAAAQSQNARVRA